MSKIILPEPEALHHPDPWRPDMPLVMTPKLRLAIDAIERAVAEAGMAALSGPAGTGKTAAARAGAVLAGVPWVSADVPHDPRGRSLALAIYGALVPPEEFDSTLTRRELEHTIQEQFVAHQRLLVLDEGQRLGADGAEDVRYLRAIPGNQTAVVLVGHELAAFLEANAAIRTRLVAWHEFTPLQGPKRFGIIKALHPLLADADEELLQRVDREWAKGVLRNWARLVRRALEIERGAPVLSALLYAQARGSLGRR